MMRIAFKVAVLVGGLLLLVTGFWWFRLSDMERWLIVNRQVVDSHASALLIGNVPETPDALIDATVSASKGVIVISFHDNHSRALVFASSDENKDRFLRENPRLVLRKLSNGWFEVIIEDE